MDPDAATSLGRSVRSPRWLAAVFVSAALVGAVLSAGYVIGWAFLVLLLLEVAWPFTLRATSTAERAMDHARFRLAPLKRYPGGLVGLVALFVGIVLGNIFPEALGGLGSGVENVVSSIGTAAPYIIFFTLTPAIAGTIRAGGAGRFAFAVNAAYIATTVIAGIYAVLMVWPMFLLGFVSPGTGSFGEVVSGIVANIGSLIFASAPFLAIWSAVGISLLMYGFGLRGVEATVSLVGGKAVELLGDLLKILLPAILFALGVFIATGFDEPIRTARQAGAIPPGVGFVGGLSAEGAYAFAVGMLVLLLSVWTFSWAFIVMRYTRLPFSRFLSQYFSDVYPYAWASSSSAATIPINIERTGEGLRVRQQVREFIIPLGATINLDGTMIGGILTTVVAAQMVGYTPTIIDLLTILIPLTIVTVGVPGIPGGLALLAGPIIADLLPLAPGSVGIFIAIFVGFNLGLSDQFRTGTNSVDNGILARLFEYWYPTHFRRQAT